MQDTNGAIKVAVITGAHGFDVINFHGLFRSIPEADVYIQHQDDFVFSPEEVRDGYDVVLFYTMIMTTPQEGERAVLEHLGETEQGIFVLHHAILGYPEWSVWENMVGIEGRGFGYHVGQTLQIDIARPDHPITRGLESWEMIDETYTMQEPGEGNEVLLTADHPKSMKSIAWTRRHKNARVFCFQSGHDNLTWENRNFYEVMRRGIMWAAGRI